MGAFAAPIAIGATLLSTAVSAVGSIQASNAAQQQAAYEERVALANEKEALIQAEDARRRGEVEVQSRRRYYSQLEGRQRAALAANGVVVDEGSALDIISDTAAMDELDTLTIRSNAEREARGFRTQGRNFRAEADLASMRGSAARRALPFEVGGTLLEGAGSVAGKWYDFKRTGAFD